MIAERPCSEQKSEKRTVAIDSRFVNLIRRIMQLSDGRFMLIVTKRGTYIDFSATPLGDVERIN